jgi:hypothetical protein
MYTSKDKKYTFTILPDGGIQIARHGEAWLTLEKGSKAIATLLGDIEDMQAELEDKQRDLDSYQTNEAWVRDHGTNL